MCLFHCFSVWFLFFSCDHFINISISASASASTRVSLLKQIQYPNEARINTRKFDIHLKRKLYTKSSSGLFYRNGRIDQCVDLQRKGGRGVVIYVQNLLGEGTVFEFWDNGFLRSAYGRKTMNSWIIIKGDRREERLCVCVCVCVCVIIIV